MRLIWHIAVKDVKRLWWEISIVLSLNAALVWGEAGRPGDVEGGAWWPLPLLLPLAWLVFIARLVHGERMVGDNEWWLARPYSRVELGSAKLLLALSIVHMVQLAGDCLILQSRGFEPWLYAPSLLSKQAMWLAGLTLPALAMACVTRGMGQFLTGMVVVLAVTGLAVSVAPGVPILGGDPIRARLVIGLMGVATMAVMYWQYSRRNTIAARTLLGAGTVACVALFVGVPVRWTMAAAYPESDVGPRLVASLERRNARYGLGALESAVWQLPVSFEQERPEVDWLREWAWAEVRAGSIRVSPQHTFWHSPELAGGSLSLIVEPKDAARLKGQKVDVEARVALREWRNVRAGRLRMNGGATPVTGIGICSAADEVTSPHVNMQVVSCESPNPLPWLIRLEFVTGEGKVFRRPLVDQPAAAIIPRLTWLSPVNRVKVSYGLTASLPDPFKATDMFKATQFPVGKTEVLVYRQESVRRGIRTVKWTGLDWERFTARR